MNLDEYMWRNKLSASRVARDIDCSTNTLGKIRRRESSTGLLLAIKLIKISDGQITIEELLSEKGEKQFKEWIGEKTPKDV